ncbi:unnamed protein product [Rhodiola kirilowii]
MDVSLSIQENLDSFLKITQELDRCEDTIKEEHQAVILLSALPHQFDNLIDVIQFGREGLTLTKITEVITQKNESLRVLKYRNGSKTEAKNEVMFVKHKRQHPAKSNKFHKPKDKSKETEKPRENVKCFYCKEMGHYMNNCPKKKKDTPQNKPSGSKTDFTNVCETIYDHEVLVVASSENANA